MTAAAKARFPTSLDNLYERGKRLVIESVQYGVTSMRAHVEVDEIVNLQCLHVALRLKREFVDLCDIQVAGPFSVFRPIY